MNTTTPLLGVEVHYVNGSETVAGYVIDAETSPLSNRRRYLVADRPGDDPSEDGKWIYASDVLHLCFECEERFACGIHAGKHLCRECYRTHIDL